MFNYSRRSDPPSLTTPRLCRQASHRHRTFSHLILAQAWWLSVPLRDGWLLWANSTEALLRCNTTPTDFPRQLGSSSDTRDTKVGPKYVPRFLKARLQDPAKAPPLGQCFCLTNPCRNLYKPWGTRHQTLSAALTTAFPNLRIRQWLESARINFPFRIV